MMAKLWERFLDKTRDVLARTFRLDMNGTDERLIYVVYVISTAEKGERKRPIDWLREAYEIAPIDYWLAEKVSFAVFQRSIYRTLTRAFPDEAFNFFVLIGRILDELN